MKSLRSTGSAVAARAAVEKFRRALERRRVGQHREAGRAARLVGARQRRRIEVGADQALRRARLLDLGDQRVVAAGDACCSIAAQEAARRRRRPCARASTRRAGARAWRRRSPRACRLRSWSRMSAISSAAFDTAISRSSRPSASPTVDRLGGERDAFLQILGLAGDDQRGRRIEQRDVAERALLALEHVAAAPPHCARRRRRAAAPASTRASRHPPA